MMESKDSFKDVSDVKDNSPKDGSNIFEATYGDKQAMKLSQATPKLGKLDSSSILPSVELFDSTVDNLKSITGSLALPGKQGQFPSERNGFDPRAANEGSPGWNDFTAKPTEPAKSILDSLRPDYSKGDGVGGGAATRDAINDLAPSRDLSGDRGGGTDKIFPPLPIGLIFDNISSQTIISDGRGQQAKTADDRAKDETEKAREQARKEQEQRDQEQKDRERKADEQKEKDQKEKDQEQKDQKNSDEDKKDKDSDSGKKGKDGNSGRPNPDDDRPQLTSADVQALRTQIANRIGGGLTNPAQPGGESKRAGAAGLGKFRNVDRVTNPVPNNDGNNSDERVVVGDRPVPKIDVSRL